MNLTKNLYLNRPRVLVAGAVLALAGILFPLSQSAQAGPVSASTTSSTAGKPTIVLEHGAWADASSWDAVIARLQRDPLARGHGCPRRSDSNRRRPPRRRLAPGCRAGLRLPVPG